MKKHNYGSVTKHKRNSEYAIQVNNVGMGFYCSADQLLPNSCGFLFRDLNPSYKECCYYLGYRAVGVFSSLERRLRVSL